MVGKIKPKDLEKYVETKLEKAFYLLNIVKLRMATNIGC